MPNGFHGSKGEWERMENPLLSLDPTLERFASTHDMELRRNYHNDPERSLIWIELGVRRLIQIFLDDDQELTFTIWICASEDRGSQRYWKQQKLRQAIRAKDLSGELETFLIQGKEILDSWKSEELQPV